MVQKREEYVSKELFDKLCTLVEMLLEDIYGRIKIQHYTDPGSRWTIGAHNRETRTGLRGALDKLEDDVRKIKRRIPPEPEVVTRVYVTWPNGNTDEYIVPRNHQGPLKGAEWWITPDGENVNLGLAASWRAEREERPGKIE